MLCPLGACLRGVAAAQQELCVLLGALLDGGRMLDDEVLSGEGLMNRLSWNPQGRHVRGLALPPDQFFHSNAAAVAITRRRTGAAPAPLRPL